MSDTSDISEYSQNVEDSAQCCLDDDLMRYQPAIKTILEDEKEILDATELQSVKMLGLLGGIFPSLIALSFVPSCISTITYIHNQTVCFRSITSLLIAISAYIVLI